MQKLLHILLLLISLLGSANLFGQETETQLKSKADLAFDKQNYVEATTAFLQLLALQPRNPEYNYKYGTCLLFNSRKKSDAIRYLEFATASGTVDIEAFFYMGKAYHLNYQFEEALKFYQLYKSTSKNKVNPELQVERQMEMCINGQKLLKNITDIIVLQKEEYAYNQFYQLYDLTGFGGNIVVSTTHQSKLDKKKGYIPIIHFAANAKRIYFASYGENEENGKQIYTKQKLQEGGWSAAELVKGAVNSKYDEDFPYLDARGEYLYFSSQGHNSMGGFDVFKSKFDPTTNSFGIPKNVDFAISSTDNDLFYIVDSLGQNAWFASSRQSQDGKISVYKVRVERLTSPIAAIKGTFVSAVHPENKKFNIEVKDATTGKFIGTFYSQNDGSYLIALPKGGKYEYAIKITGSAPIFKAVVNVPVLNAFKPLKQQIVHEENDGKEIVKVIDLFDQDVENAESILAELVQLRSELNVNSNQFDLNALENSSGKEVLSGLGLRGLSPLEAKDRILELSQKQADNIKVLEENEQKSIAKVIDNAATIKKYQAEVKNLANQTNSEADPEEQYKLFVAAEKKTAEISGLEQENLRLSRHIDSVNSIKQTEITKTKSIEKFTAVLVKAKEDAEILKIFADNTEQIKSIQAESSASPTEKLVAEILKLKSERDQLSATRKAVQNSAKQLESEIENLEVKLNAAKSKDKLGFQNSIDFKRSELETIQREINTIDSKVAQITVPLENKEAQLEYFQGLQKLAKPGKTLTISEVKKAIESTENQNYKTLKSYVTQQRVSLENSNQKSSESSDASSNNAPVSQENLVSEISPDYTSKVSEINANNSLTETEKLQMLQFADNELNKKIATEIALTEEKLIVNAGDIKSQEKLQSLRKIQQVTDDKLAKRSEKLEVLEIGQDDQEKGKSYSADEIIKELKPDLDRRMDDIANDPNLSVIEQLKLSQNESLEFEQILEKQITVLEEKLAETPSDQTAKKQLTALQKLKKEVAENIDNRSLAIQSLDPESEVQVAKPSKSTTLNEVDPTYENKMEAIQNDGAISPQEKMKQLQAQDENLVRVTKNAIAQAETTLKKNPNDSKMQAQYENLLEIEEEASVRIAARKEVLTENEIVSVPVENLETKSDVAMELKPDHAKKIIEIQNDDLLSKQEKQNKLIQEEVKFQKAIAVAVKSNAKILAKEPNNQEALRQKSELIAVREASENRVDEAKQLLVSEAKTAIKTDDLLFQTDKNYQLDIQKIENGDPTEKSTKLAERERKSQAILNTQVQKNVAQLAKKDDPKLAAENQVLNELIDASEKRIDLYEQNNLPENIESVENIEVQPSAVENNSIEKIRAEKLGSNVNELETVYSSPEDLKKQKHTLETYQKDLKILVQENKKMLSKKPADASLLNAKTQLLSEQKLVEQKLEEIGLSIEKPVVVEKNDTPVTVNENVKQNSTATEFAEHPDVVALQKEHQSLEEKLQKPDISPREVKTVKSEITANETKQVKVENSLKTEKISDQTVQILQETKALSTTIRSDDPITNRNLAAIASIENSENLNSERLKAVKSEKNPVVQRELLNEVLSEQQKNEAKVSEIKLDQLLSREVEKLQESDPSVTIYKLESTKGLENRRRRGIIEIGDLSSEIEKLDATIASSKKTDAKKLSATRDLKMKELNSLQNTLSNVDAELESRSKSASSVYDESAINAPISYEDERKIAASESYKSVAKIAQEADKIQKSLANNVSTLETLKQENELSLRENVRADASATPTKKQTEILVLTKLISEEKKQLLAKKSEADKIINESEDPMKFQNLIARAIEPLKTVAIVATLVPLPLKGFEIVSNPSVAPPKTSIPVNVAVPSGLVYRVQVGAFAKPVREELFKEFNPVSGEKLNSGITRYMAGYFNNKTSVLDARKEIQNLGYADAFPVAYCDGQRISMQEAQRLEESGQCVALGVETLVMEASENVTDVLPAAIPSDTNRRKISTVNSLSAYNEAPGAAKAIAVETRLGLFFTVQIGVYNKPVPVSQIKNMEPLITKRLVNGQIRYSAGIFSAIESAQPKKKEAIARGIADAYITAYYKGERISLDEARKLLSELGNGILEKENPKENKIVSEEKIIQLEKETQKIESRIILENKVGNDFNDDRVQFISKKTFDDFPTDFLKRCNENGTFYYDVNDQKVKSMVYKNEDYTPQVYYIRKEIDTVFIAKNDTLQQEDTYQITARFSATELTGEVGEWLIRLGYQREIMRVDEGQIQLRIVGIKQEEKFDEILTKMRALGFNILIAGG